MDIELPKLTVQQKWEKAEGNLIYFVVCGISYARAHGDTAASFGRWAGEVAAPYWEAPKELGPRGLVQGISENKQQFRGFEMEILDASEERIYARMKCFGEETMHEWLWHEITAQEYIEFFGEKWAAIADHLGLSYKQHMDGDWLVFTVTKK